MKRSHRKVLDHLRQGSRVWSSAGEKTAYVVSNGSDYRNVRRSILNEMEELGLVETRTRGDRYEDTHWHFKIRSSTIGYFVRLESREEIGTPVGPFRDHLRFSERVLYTHDNKWVAYLRQGYGWLLRDELRSPHDLNEPMGNVVVWAEPVKSDAQFIELLEDPNSP